MTELLDRMNGLSAAKRALLERLSNANDRADIAIVGIGCRFPGGPTPEAFWTSLHGGVDLRRTVPDDRWDAGAFFDPDPDARARSYARQGYFLEGVDRFDPAFFGISMREARAMDPQQRLLLEVVWEAVEDAGYAATGLAESDTGVFIGCYGDEYLHLQIWSGDLAAIDAHTATGSHHSTAVGRISHFLGLRGPCLAIDTACSSSLVALHVACESLRRRECDLALAGGVSLTLSAESPVGLSRARMLAADGRCKTFDAGADGYGRGEGCGVLVLKRLDDALRAGDSIRAMIRGSAVAHDGRASTLTAPNGPAQVAVIRRALSCARVEASAIDYVEAHGTGTPLGDPIELQALGEVFGGRDAAKPLRVGSVKTNIGHLEAAAGVAGVIKAVLALEHEEIPAHLNLNELNPHLGIQGLPLEIARSPTPWPRATAPRLAGVSSFGFGGTNAHVVVGEAPRPVEAARRAPRGGVLTLSAHCKEELVALVERFESALSTGATDMEDVCFTTNVGRVHRAHRFAAHVDSSDDAVAALSAFRRDEAAIAGSGSTTRGPSVVALFTGQGSEYHGMGRELFETERVFREVVERADGLLATELGASLVDVLYGGEASLIHRTAWTQPALYVLECALAALWSSWGIRPAAVLGHSIGEYVAAHVAGVFSFEDGLKLVAARGRAMQSLPGGGAMLAVFAGEDLATRLIADAGLDCSIAAVNTPDSVVISGRDADISEIRARLEQQGVTTRRLAVAHAFHSSLMDPILDEFEQVVGSIALRAPVIPLISNVTGGVAGSEVTRASYWRRHARQAVRFAEGVQVALGRWNVFVEMGPNPVLATLGARAAGDREAVWLPSLRRGNRDRRQMLESLAELYVRGADVAWERFAEGRGSRRVPLPTYPFLRRERCWLDSADRGRERLHQATRTTSAAHPLIGRRLALAVPDHVFETTVSAERPAFLDDHRLFDRVVVPAAFYLTMILAASIETSGTNARTLEGVVFPELLALDGTPTTLQVVLSARGRGVEALIYGSPRKGELDSTVPWTLHARAMVRTSDGTTADSGSKVEEGRELDPTTSGHRFYERMQRAGFQLGARFRWVSEVRTRPGEARVDFRAPEADEAATFPLVPGFIDACIQTLAAASLETFDGDGEQLFVPIGVDTVELHPSSSKRLHGHAVLRPDESGTTDVVGDVWVMDERGRTVVSLRGLRARRMLRQSLLERVTPRLEGSYVTVWRESPARDVQPMNGRVLLVGGGETSSGTRLARALENAGATVSHAPCGLEDPADVELAIARAAREAPLTQILYLSALDAATSRRESSVRPEDLCWGALCVIRALARLSLPSAPCFRVVTQGAVSVQSVDVVDPVQTTLWGLGRTIALEHPELFGGLLDLDPSVFQPSQADGIVRAFSRKAGAVSLALRGDRFFVPRLASLSAAAPEAIVPVDGEGTYLISGGLGALGSTVAEWLESRGAQSLVLVGRSAPDAEVASRISAAKRRGVDIVVERADIADRSAMAELLRRVRSRGRLLKGVVHAAGVLGDGVLLQQSRRQFESVFSAKVTGGTNLHLETLDDPLDFFVLFSSVASLFGSPGQANYAAANAYLDGLAHARRFDGLKATSINWGPWSRIGMAANRVSHGADLVGSIDREEGLQLLERALVSDVPQMAAVTLRGAEHELPEPLADLLTDVGPAARRRKPVPRGTEFVTRVDLLAAPVEERRQMLSRSLCDEIAQVLELEPSRVEATRTINDLGLDSLLSLELKNRIENTLEVRLPLVRLLNGPTIDELAGVVLALMLDAEPQQPVVRDTDESEVSHLTDRQVDALLLELSTERRAS